MQGLRKQQAQALPDVHDTVVSWLRPRAQGPIFFSPGALDKPTRGFQEPGWGERPRPHAFSTLLKIKQTLGVLRPPRFSVGGRHPQQPQTSVN
jgi:hypothetical protein